MKFDKVVSQLMESGMDPFFTSAAKRDRMPIPDDAYTFTKGKISDSAWDQDKYWYNAKGDISRIDQMSSYRLRQLMQYIHDVFPKHLDSTLFNAIKAQQVKVRADELRNPANRYQVLRRYEK